MERFWKKINKLGPDQCHEWIASTNRNGYGQFKWFDHGNGKQKVIEAHRVAWFLEKGEWPHYLCHTCDNNKCVNTAHMYEGGPQANADDRATRNRSKYHKKHSDALVLQIRAEYASGISSGELAERHKIPRGTILGLIDHATRKDVGGSKRDRGFRYYGNRYKKSITQE